MKLLVMAILLSGCVDDVPEPTVDNVAICAEVCPDVGCLVINDAEVPCNPGEDVRFSCD
jgi:hypothetical protein